MKSINKYSVFLTAALIVCSCQEKIEDPGEPSGPGKAYRTEFQWGEPVDIFGFQPQNRYSYCPSVIEMADGSCHMFFCGNPQENRFVDHVYHMVIKADGTKTTPVSVLQPTAGTWDSFHCCDPNVIEGQFKMDGVSYKYAMFYLGIDKGDCKGNEVGVAFSNDLNADSWVKYPRQLVPFTGNRNAAWGVGQPSAVSLDRKGKVLLTYTVGDEKGTRVVFSEVEMSDMSSLKISDPQAVSSMGFNLILHNADFAVDEAGGKIVMSVAGNWPDVYPTFIESFTAVAYMDFKSFLEGKGTWKRYKDIDSSVSGFYRNHNACVMRDSFGYLKSYKTPTVFFTTSKTAPTAEWSYHIYRTDSKLEKVEVTD